MILMAGLQFLQRGFLPDGMPNILLDRGIKMEVKLTGPKILRLQSAQVAYILDTLALRPYKDVNGLINDIFAQLKHQEIENESSTGSASAPPRDGVSGSGPAD